MPRSICSSVMDWNTCGLFIKNLLRLLVTCYLLLRYLVTVSSWGWVVDFLSCMRSMSMHLGHPLLSEHAARLPKWVASSCLSKFVLGRILLPWCRIEFWVLPLHVKVSLANVSYSLRPAGARSDSLLCNPIHARWKRISSPVQIITDIERHLSFKVLHSSILLYDKNWRL